MIPLSDLCKNQIPRTDVYLHSVTLQNKLGTDTIACTLEYDLSSLHVLTCEIGSEPVQIPIPDGLRNMCKGFQWLYLSLEACGDSKKNVDDSPLELRMTVCVEPRSDVQQMEKIDGQN